MSIGCGHTICAECEKNIDPRRCPFCDRPITNPVPNYKMQEFINTITNTTIPTTTTANIPTTTTANIPRTICLTHVLLTYPNIGILSLYPISTRNVQHSVTKLLKISPDHLLKTYQGALYEYNLLHALLASRKHHKFTKTLIEKYNSEYIDHIPECPYIIHAMCGHNLSMIEYLILDKKVDICTTDKNLHTIFMCCTTIPQFFDKILEIITFVVDHVASIDDANKSLLNKIINMQNIHGSTAMHLQICAKNYECVKYLLNCGADVNIKNKHNDTIIMYAINHNNLSMLQYIMTHSRVQPDVHYKNIHNCTTLMLAINHRNLDMIKYLIEYSNALYPTSDTLQYVNARCGKNNATALHAIISIAIEDNTFDIVKYLVNAGANIHLTNQRNETALVIAAKNATHPSSLSILQYLISCLSDANIPIEEKKTELTDALLAAITNIKTSSLEIIKCLVASGATVTRDALCCACKAISLPVVKYLVEECNVDVNALTAFGTTQISETGLLTERTPENITIALKIIEYLVMTCKADVNMRDASGQTALMYAATYARTRSSVRIVEQLLRYGATTDIVDNYGNTAYEYALRHKDGTSTPEVVNLLSTYNKNTSTVQ